MNDCEVVVKKLREVNVLDVKNRPAHTVGVIHGAADVIEKLAKEVERLNWENMWLSRGDD